MSNRFASILFGVIVLLGSLVGAQSQSYFYNIHYATAFSTPVAFIGGPVGFCGDYVCNYWESHNTCPSDCIVGGSGVLATVVDPSTLGAAKRCSDGTGYGACSVNRPNYCDNGNLTSKPEICGCPSGTFQTAANTCVAVCSDGTLSGQCSQSLPWFCQSGVLTQNPAQCGCPSGTARVDNTCVGIKPACSVSANPNPVNALAPTTVSISFFELANAPFNARVDCGNGQTVGAVCSTNTGSPNGPATGTCTATCGYPEGPTYPAFATVKADLDGLSCASATLKVLPPIPTTGSILVKVTAADTGAVVPNAQVGLGGNNAVVASNLLTNANGEVLLTRLQPMVYTVMADSPNASYAIGGASGSVEAGRTTILPISLTLNPATTCDVTMDIAGQLSPVNAAAPAPLQLRLTNQVNSTRITTLANAGSLVPLDFVASQAMAALEQRLVTLTPRPDVSLNGASTAKLALTTGNCTQYLDVPLRVNGGLTIEASDTGPTAFTGGRACYNLLVRNRGNADGTVTMSAQTNFDVQFDTPSFFLGRREDRRVQACTSVPSGTVPSNYSFAIKAASTEINDAQIRVSLNVPAQAFQAPSTCFDASRLNGTVLAAFELRNNAQGGDYVLELDRSPDDSGISIVQPAVYNFPKGTSRIMYLRIDPFVSMGGEQRLTATVKTVSDGLVVQQLPLCVRIQGLRGISAQLSATQLQLSAGGDGKLVRYLVRNEGNTQESFLVVANTSFTGVTISPSSFRLSPGDSQNVEVFLSPVVSTPPGIHKVILDTYVTQVRRENLLRSDALTVLVQPNTTTIGANSLKVDVASPSFNFSRSGNTTIAVATFSVTSHESVPVRVVGALQDLPDGWSYRFASSGDVVQPGETVNLTAHITMRGVENRDYEATLVVTSGDAQVVAPFIIPVSSASVLSGLFTLGSFENLALLVLIAMAGAAGYFYYRSREIEDGSEMPPTGEATIVDRSDADVAA